MSTLIISCSLTRGPQTNNVQQSSGQVSGGDGSSYAQAVVIEEKSESTGVTAEYAWLKKHYPGYRMKSQSLNFHKNKPYDILSIVPAEGEEKEVYFDISNFYGKF